MYVPRGILPHGKSRCWLLFQFLSVFVLQLSFQSLSCFHEFATVCCIEYQTCMGGEYGSMCKHVCVSKQGPGCSKDPSERLWTLTFSPSGANFPYSFSDLRASSERQLYSNTGVPARSHLTIPVRQTYFFPPGTVTVGEKKADLIKGFLTKWNMTWLLREAPMRACNGFPDFQL